MFGGAHDDAGDDTAGAMQDTGMPLAPPQNDLVDPTQDTDSSTVVGGPSSTAQTFEPASPAVPPAGAPAVPEDLPAASSLPSTAASDGDDLLNIKQQALQQLSPLIGHLDQTPEEKFRTTMMMIQASDNKELIKEAYAAAQQITDEKSRAQALLDIVNEINYFTQHTA